MTRCLHTHWLSLRRQDGEAALLESDRLRSLTAGLPYPESQRPSLFVLVGNKEKSAALKAAFGVKRARSVPLPLGSRIGGVHLHVDPSSVFSDRPILLAEHNIHEQVPSAKHEISPKCHETARRVLRRAESEISDVYPHLLFPFADVFCLFVADFGSLKAVARFLARWLDHDRPPASPKSALPSVVVVADEPLTTAEGTDEARRAVLLAIGEETSKDLLEHVAAINILGLLPRNLVSTTTRYRHVRDRVLRSSDQARKSRADARMLFSATHLAALMRSASAHFAGAVDEPFDLVKASRMHNPVDPQLDEHLSNFLVQITLSSQLIEFAAPMVASALFLDSYPPGAHAFDPRLVFTTLYKNTFKEGNLARVIAFDQTDDFLLRSGLIELVEKNFVRYFHDYVSSGKSAVDIHSQNLACFQDRWSEIRSTNTCLCCLRRRPQYDLPCRHCVSENCVVVFGSRCGDDPWIFRLGECLLCKQQTPSDIEVRVRPPTAGVGVLCIDGGGARGIIPLAVMKLLQDRLGPIPLQRCITVSFGVSVGVIIAIEHFILGRPLQESMTTFSEMASRVFKKRASSSIPIPLLSRVADFVVSYLTDGIYSASNVDAALRDWIKSRSILDCSHATSTGTKIGLPVATVSDHPSCRLFTNYNGAGERDCEQGESATVPKDGLGNVPLWKIARAASAAAGFFPPQHIDGVGTFQDPGALENDPVLWALSEVSAVFPGVETPDFVISLGTGEPGQHNYEVSTADCRSMWRNGMVRRLFGLMAERTREKPIRRACKTIGRMANIFHKIHRLNLDFQSNEPQLDDATCIPALISQVEMDRSLSVKIDRAADCLVAALFYFELTGLPERRDGRYVASGHVHCAIRRSEPAFGAVYKMPVEVETEGTFTLKVKQGASNAYNISGSPLSVQGLVDAQGLDAPGAFGREDHGKRKRPWPCTRPAGSGKRQRRRDSELGNASARTCRPASLAKRNLVAKGVQGACWALRAGLI
ncbi:FabD/lysophospholipase-like protein [Lizonia empirigonia]|nr:FabD/lysophospholipase-like protein [Lizonia empirigonia]